MKAVIFTFFFFLCTEIIVAQFTIAPGAQISLTGSVQLTLLNTDLVNDGNLTTDSSTISFTGDASSNISGSRPVPFYILEINKSNNKAVLLQQKINAGQQINFINGLLDLNGFDADLGTTGTLNGEQENSRVVGTNGGQLLFTTTLNAPLSVNPGNLGAIITSPQNLGNTLIKRGHQSQNNGNGNGNSILRYYDIVPANNTALNATLRLQYLDAELNGLDENNLVLWRSTDNLNWVLRGFSTRNININFVENSGIDAFSRWTLSPVDNALPVHFISFNAQCNDDRVILRWKTSQEINAAHYDIQRATDGISWKSIGSVSAINNQRVQNDYSFTDNTAVANSYYRIAENDINGAMQLTNIIQSSCGSSNLFQLWPNPATDNLFLSLISVSNSQAEIQVFDATGVLVKKQNNSLKRGNNRLLIDISNLPPSVYQLVIVWNNGINQKNVKLVKQ